ncbi:MAG: chemotaxis protein CheW [Magnetococcales bacterium]|nr:chemotaxis protein CheW [Magnetococcales bacterium]
MLFLSLKLAREVYAVETLRVKEVLQPVKITRVPRTGLEVCGVINLRGSIITVFDLRMLLGMEKSTLTPHSNIVVLEYPHEGELLVRAFLVDSVREVLELDQEQLGAPPASRRGGSKHLQYMAKSDHGFILILDVANLFGLQRVTREVENDDAIGIDEDLELPSADAAPGSRPPAVRAEVASVEETPGTRSEVVTEREADEGAGSIACAQSDVGSGDGVLGDEAVESVGSEVASRVEEPSLTGDLGEETVAVAVVPEAPVEAPAVTEDLGGETVSDEVAPEAMAKGSDSSGEEVVCDDEVKIGHLEGDGAFRSEVAMVVGGASISSAASGMAVGGGTGRVEGEGGHGDARGPGGPSALEQNRPVFVNGGEPSPEHRTRLLEVGGLAAMAEALEVPSFSGDAQVGTVPLSGSVGGDGSSLAPAPGERRDGIASVLSSNDKDSGLPLQEGRAFDESMTDPVAIPVSDSRVEVKPAHREKNDGKRGQKVKKR